MQLVHYLGMYLRDGTRDVVMFSMSMGCSLFGWGRKVGRNVGFGVSLVLGEDMTI